VDESASSVKSDNVPIIASNYNGRNAAGYESGSENSNSDYFSNENSDEINLSETKPILIDSTRISNVSTSLDSFASNFSLADESTEHNDIDKMIKMCVDIDNILKTMNIAPEDYIKYEIIRVKLRYINTQLNIQSNPNKKITSL